jgi:hypothetical protein
MAIVLRTDKGSPLTYAELDGNFTDLDARLNQLQTAEVNSVNGLSGNVILTTTNINEGTNLYFTNDRFETRFETKTTDHLEEGDTNLYFTNARSRASVSAGLGLVYNSTTGVISISTSTTNITEGTNLYYTDARADARIALANAEDLADVEYSTSPVTGDVLTWNSIANIWEPAQPPGATGGEANTASNIGAGQGIFAVKVSQDLRFYSLAGANGITVSTPSANVITISQDQDLSTSADVAFNSIDVGEISILNDTISSNVTNANIILSPNGTGNIIIDNAGANRIFFAGANNELRTHNNLTYDGTNVNVTGGITVSTSVQAPQFISNITTGTPPFSVLSTTVVPNLTVAAAGTAATVTTAAQPNITSVGTLTSLTVDDITLNGSTITSAVVDGNINITPNGTGSIVVTSLAVGDLTTNRITFAQDAAGHLTDSANLTFNGTTLTVTGNANATTVNATTVNGGNVRLQSNHIETINTNGNLNINPNGTGNVGIKKASPATALDVNGTITSTGLSINGAVVLGAATSDNISLLGRFASSFIPTTTGSIDLGSSALKFRSAFLAGSLSVDGSTTLGDNSGDLLTITASVNSSVVPATTNNFDLGSTSIRWRDIYLSGDINFSGGDLITGSATTNLINTTATTVNFAGAATLITTGATSGTAIYQNPTQIFGNGDTSATPAASTIRATDGNGTNIVGANLTIRAGRSTGTAAGGTLIFQTANAAAGSGGALNSPTTRMSIDTAINVTANILPSANVTYNIGSTSARFTNLWGQSSSALYADLAERYAADQIYDVGTVLVFGGEEEVTTSNIYADTSVAGVVSENPAYLMNDGFSDNDKYPAVALRGKVKVKCVGKVSKGDLLVTSNIHGFAESVGKNDLGNAVFAKAISNKLDIEQGLVWAVII